MIDFNTLSLNKNMLEMYDGKQKNLKTLRLFLGISPKKVYYDLRIHPSSISRYERGGRNISDKNLLKMLSYYSKEFDKYKVDINQELTIEQVIKNMNLIKDDCLTEKGKKMLSILKSFE